MSNSEVSDSAGGQTAPSTVSKGYLVVEHPAVDHAVVMERMQNYIRVVMSMLEKYQIKYLTVPGPGGEIISVEGGWKPESFAIIEFPTFEMAKEFYFSEEYQSVLPERLGLYEWSKGILVEGAPSPVAGAAPSPR